MPRKGSQKNQQGSRRCDADLLNFQLPQRPKQQPVDQKKSHPKKSFTPKSNAYKPKRKTGQFPLHCSPDHAFVITRQGYHGGEGQYSFHGSDEAVSWESVRIVKYLTTAVLECPICLDSFVCARITKCGHCYCLTCLIRHIQHSTDSPQGPKCPCCSIPVHLTDTRAVQLVYIQDSDSAVRRFVKLHRVKSCPAPYLPQVGQPRRGALHAAPTVNEADAAYCRFNYVDSTLYQELLRANLIELETSQCGTMMEDLCRGQAIQIIQGELTRAVTESQVEHALEEQFLNPTSGVSMMQLSSLVASPQVTSRARQNSCGEISHCSEGSTVSNTQAKYGGSMYLNDADDYMFYQVDDGSLFFLSAFNIKCLRAEFSSGPPNTCSSVGELSLDGSHPETPEEQPNFKAPLPDVVEGRIIEINRMQLTKELRERLRFLSHLPHHTEIAFVEISLGHLLSNSTKKMFKKEFQRRLQKRSAKTNAEKRADAKMKQKEEERVNELKARYQSIDPSDEFFHVPTVEEPPIDVSGDHFGPSLGNATGSQSLQRSSTTAFSFSEVIRAGEAFPSLNAANTETNFPSLGAASTPTSHTTQGWKGRASRTPKTSSWDDPKANGVSVMTQLVPKNQRGSKAKKTVLLSTTHRGGL